MSGRPSMSGHILRLWLLLSLATLLGGMLLAPLPTRAQHDRTYAGLVNGDAQGRMTHAWIPFDEEAVAGIDLLKRSSVPTETNGFEALCEGVTSSGGAGLD